MKENYYALMIAIFGDCPPEQAYELFHTGRRRINKDDVPDMLKLKKSGLTYREIGERYGVSGKAIRSRLSRAKIIPNVINFNEKEED